MIKEGPQHHEHVPGGEAMSRDQRDKFLWLENLERASGYEFKYLGIDKAELSTLSKLPDHVQFSEKEHFNLPKGIVAQAELVREKALMLKRAASFYRQSNGDPSGRYKENMRERAMAVIALAVRMIMSIDKMGDDQKQGNLFLLEGGDG